MSLQPKNSFILNSSSAKFLHTLLTICVIIAVTFQGKLQKFDFFSIPIWAILILFLTLYFLQYFRFISELSFPVKKIYLYLLFLILLITFLNIYIPIYKDIKDTFDFDIKRVGTLPLAFILLTAIFYEYRDNVENFIKLIMLIIFIHSFFSFIQFYFEIDFFEEFTRKTLMNYDAYQIIGPFGFSVNVTHSKLTNWDTGSSGGFGFPVPYGYFIASFFPIIFPFVLVYFKKVNYHLKILILVACLFCIFSFFLSMQRAAIIASLASLIVLSLYELGLRRGFLIFLVFSFTLISLDSSNIFDKNLLSFTDIVERISAQYTWAQNDIIATKLGISESTSPHMYFYNLYHDYGLITLMMIFFFYILLCFYLYISRQKNNIELPNGAFEAAILGVISYNLVALFHNNGHFMIDIVGFIFMAYILIICNLAFKSKYPLKS
jgi:hypothetical protein